jgi:hypothetical protein
MKEFVAVQVYEPPTAAEIDDTFAAVPALVA